METFKPGDRVVVEWGLDAVMGTVLSLFGPPGKQFARVEVELPGEEGVPLVEAVSLPVDLLSHPSSV